MTRVFIVRRNSSKASGNRFFHVDEAHRFLRAAAVNQDNLRHFRSVISRERSGERPQAGDALYALATLLASGRLRIARKHKKSIEGVGATSGAGPAALPETEPASMPRQSLLPRTTPSEMRVRAVEEPTKVAPTPVAKVDTAQQVAILLQAAQSGTPFCEQCEEAENA